MPAGEKTGKELQEVNANYGFFHNYLDGRFEKSDAPEIKVINPATGAWIASVAASREVEVSSAVDAAATAFESWSRKPLSDRVGRLFALRNLAASEAENLARIIVQENGKTIGEARGEVWRGIDNIDASIGSLYLLKESGTRQVTEGVDEEMEREPLGVFSAVTPFNFPAMIPFWFLPYALATGNTFILKPSERTPATMNYLFRKIHEAKIFPPGVLSLINGAKSAVDALIANKDVSGISFVGSTPVARYIFEQCSVRKKRVQAQASAKNFVVVMPDAKLSAVMPNLINSFYGNAGQRCLAGSNLVVFDGNHQETVEKFTRIASGLRLGYGLDEEVDMGPVITKEQKKRVSSFVERGRDEGADLILDGREAEVHEYSEGNFVGPSVLDNATVDMTVTREEIFGPVASVIELETLEEAIDAINTSIYGNMAAIFTSDPVAARKFTLSVRAGNLGVNIGVPAPAATYPFGGYRDSFFGDLHGQGGEDYVQFYTERKIVVSRWL